VCPAVGPRSKIEKPRPCDHSHSGATIAEHSAPIASAQPQHRGKVETGQVPGKRDCWVEMAQTRPVGVAGFAHPLKFENAQFWFSSLSKLAPSASGSPVPGPSGHTQFHPMSHGVRPNFRFFRARPLKAVRVAWKKGPRVQFSTCWGPLGPCEFAARAARAAPSGGRRWPRPRPGARPGGGNGWETRRVSPSSSQGHSACGSLRSRLCIRRRLQGPQERVPRSIHAVTDLIRWRASAEARPPGNPEIRDFRPRGETGVTRHTLGDVGGNPLYVWMGRPVFRCVGPTRLWMAGDDATEHRWVLTAPRTAICRRICPRSRSQTWYGILGIGRAAENQRPFAPQQNLYFWPLLQGHAA
jgi:hypothetical protein